MSTGKALRDFRLGTLRTPGGKKVTTAKEAAAIGREQEKSQTFTAGDAANALARRG